MRSLVAALGLSLIAPHQQVAELPIASPNPNTESSGTLANGVLTLSLEARRAIWYPNGDSLPGREVPAFAESGKRPSVPGPLIRVPAGTLMNISVRNVDFSDTLHFLVPSFAVAGGDTTFVPPGEVRTIRVTASRQGNFHYRASARDTLSRILQIRGQLAGAIVVDSPRHAGPFRDRVFVMTWSVDSMLPPGRRNMFSQTPAQGLQLNFARSIFGINGRSWPHTERLTATVGDSLRWRVINLSDDIHPMHLHGFYFRVDDFSSATAERDGQAAPGRMVVTERMPQFSSMTTTWVPERAGNWLYHCHFAAHLLPAHALANDGATIFAPEPVTHGTHAAVQNHALTGMAGLVLGVTVQPRRGERVNEPARGRRLLRLIAVQDSGFAEPAPSLRFRLEESIPSRSVTVTETTPGISPPIHLRRDEPVSIMVHNRMGEATAVHWHGIELDSYYDGVAGYGGFGSRVAPIIAPRDSFEVRFTPPRAGTFIYHSHVNEPRQHRAGLAGALIVHDSTPSDNDVIVLLKAPRARLFGSPSLEINGQIDPDTVVVKFGRPVRVRLISLTYTSPNATVWLTARPDSSFVNLRDTMVVQWRPIAKDGRDLPESARTTKPGGQLITMGETYDFEFIPPARGNYRIESRTSGPNGRLQARLPIRVE